MIKYKKFLSFILAIITIMLFSSCAASESVVRLILDYPMASAKHCDKMMYLSLKVDNFEGMKEAVADGANIDETAGAEDNGTKNPIRIVLFTSSDKKIPQFLLEHGADANYTDDTGVSLLMYSAYHSDTVMCKLLLEHGADLNQAGKDSKTYRLGKVNYIAHNGYTALDYSLAGQGSVKDIEGIISLLLEHGAKADSKTVIAAMNGYNKNGYCRYDLVHWIIKEFKKEGRSSGLDPLSEAAIMGETTKVRELVNSNKLTKQNEQLVLFNTAAFGSVDVLKFLFEKGFAIDALDKDNNTLLIAAAENGNLEMVKYLLNSDVDPDEKNINGDSALMLAVRNNQEQTAEYLLDHGASVVVASAQNAFDEAVSNGNIKMMKAILSHGYDDVQDESRLKHSIGCAVNVGSLDVLKLLLSKNALNGDGYNEALTDACLFDKLTVTEYLVQRGADVNGGSGTYRGQPLLTAAQYASPEIVEYLLRNGANANASNGGDTSLTYAIAAGKLETVKLLAEKGADLEENFDDTENDTPIIVAAQNTSKNILEYLVEKGAKINYQNADGKTALMYAASSGFTENVKALLENNADVTLKDQKGQTALDFAKENGYREIVLLLQNASKKH